MEVRFSLTPEEQSRSLAVWRGDEIERQTAVDPQSRARTVSLVILLLGAGVIVLQAATLRNLAQLTIDIVEAVILVPAIGFGIVIGLTRFAKPIDRGVEQIVVSSRAALRWSTGVETVDIPWDDVGNIHLSDFAVVIETDNHLDRVIPIRAFQDQAVAAEF